MKVRGKTLLRAVFLVNPLPSRVGRFPSLSLSTVVQALLRVSIPLYRGCICPILPVSQLLNKACKKDT